MQNRRMLLVVAGLIALVIVVAVGWWLASPLFINRSVDEAFPFEVPNAAALADMPADQRQALETEFMEAVPSEEEVAALPEADRATVEEQVMGAAAAVMSDKMVEDTMPEAANEWIAVSMGEFMDADSFHQGSGTAAIFQQGDQRVLRFENFEVTNGPDLHILLVKHPAPTQPGDVGEDYVDLGQLKGNMGNQNYDIPTDIDLSEYQSVVIYCKPFHVLFSIATLN